MLGADTADFGSSSLGAADFGSSSRGDEILNGRGQILENYQSFSFWRIFTNSEGKMFRKSRALKKKKEKKNWEGLKWSKK